MGQLAWNKGVSPSEETRRKMSIAQTGKIISSVTRLKLSQSAKKIREVTSARSKRMWAEKDPVVAALEIQRLHSYITDKVLCGTKPEWALFRILLEAFPKHFVINLNKFSIGRKFPDFICFKHQLVVEMFGMYWHGEKRTGLSRSAAERSRRRHFVKYGYKAVVIWEDEVNKKTVRRKLRPYLKGE